MRTHHTPFLLLSIPLLATACAVDDDLGPSDDETVAVAPIDDELVGDEVADADADALDGVSPLAPEDLSSALVGDARGLPGEGERGTARVRTSMGVTEIDFVVIGGRAVAEGDLDLGPVEMLLRARGGAADLGGRWPNGKVRYTFHPGFVGTVCNEGDQDARNEPLIDDECIGAKEKVRAVIAELEARTPLDFIEIEHSGASGAYITFQWMDGDDAAAGRSAVGHQGTEQTIWFRQDGGQPSWGVARHEILHALGLWHEQSRSDRNAFVEIHDECIDPDAAGNFTWEGASADLGPYDYDSIMHYRETSFCATDDEGACICAPIERLFGAGGLGGRVYSREDLNSLHRMYAVKQGTNEADDHLGQSLATGDFDGDGYTDVAVGAPDEDRGAGTNAGAVILYRGTSVGLVAWDLIVEGDFSSAETYGSNERFGAAVAAGDFDGDGIDDLAVGAPGEAGAGAVYVFRGSARGLSGLRKLTQGLTGADADEAGDRFGAALAFGRLTGLDQEVLAVGAPGETNPGVWGAKPNSGAAYLFQQVDGLLHRPTRLAPSLGGGYGDEFGAALASADLDGNGKDDLAVGVPGASSDAGEVYVYQGRRPTEHPLLWSEMASRVQVVTRASAAAGDRFGAALTIGDFSSVAGSELAIGSPGRGGKGDVTVWRLRLGSLGVTTPLELQTTLTQGTGAEAGDEFGAALAAGEVLGTGGFDELVVGVPGEDAQAGKLSIFRHNGTAFGAHHQFFQPAGFTTQESGDRFGAAVAVGNIDGAGDCCSVLQFDNEAAKREDVIVGLPGEAPEVSLFAEDPAGSGAVLTLLGESGVSPSTWRFVHQETTGREP
jgi:hypothetical protein